ncbi:MAG TPA: GGDEF domain-containing protein [Solirubrobacteraceae bacterium]|jgi:diguanylate cyclase (GGDEF)-like protein|nr:GGDEF domain-containing protein [Solirubrobacteraceae bacterium]
MIDLDHFKDVNDRLGHDAGDQVLIGVARVLEGRVRESDVVGRLGGDEFAVLMTEGGEPEAQTLARDLADLVRRQGITGGVSASIGVVVFDGRDDRSTADYLADADRAMYVAKRARPPTPPEG